MHDPITELRELAREVRQYQQERGWSDNELVRQISHIGSSKPFKRILNEKDDLTDGMNVERQLENYRAARVLIEQLRGKDALAEPEYPDFSNIVTSKIAIHRALAEHSIARLVIIQGPTGTGKDAVLKHCLNEWSNIAVSVEADEHWRHSAVVPPRAILTEIAVRRDVDGGEFKLPFSPWDQQQELYRRLNKRKLVLFINEAHHMGPRALNDVKGIISNTPTVVVMLCIPALLRRLEMNSHEEVIQLTGNRLQERVTLTNPPSDEVLTLLKRRGVKFDSAAAQNTIARMVTERAPMFGNWRFVSLVARELVAASDRQPVTDDVGVKAINAVEARRIGKQRGGAL